MMGAVLAGGKSLRFGKNKALEVLGGKRLVERSVESLRPFCDRIVLIVNELAPYADLGITLIRDVIPHQGPLGGIYTALLFSPDEWVFVKATDMPLMVPELGSLIKESGKDCDAVVPMVGAYYEPLLAMYHRRCLPAIAGQLKGTEERQIIRFYKKIKVKSIPEEQWRKIDPEGLSFRNVNTPGDLAEIGWT